LPLKRKSVTQGSKAQYKRGGRSDPQNCAKQRVGIAGTIPGSKAALKGLQLVQRYRRRKERAGRGARSPLENFTSSKFQQEESGPQPSKVGTAAGTSVIENTLIQRGKCGWGKSRKTRDLANNYGRCRKCRKHCGARCQGVSAQSAMGTITEKQPDIGTRLKQEMTAEDRPLR